MKPYCFRRDHGEALDSSSHISDSQRNLILQHSSSAVFQHNYLSRYITQDTQVAYRGLEPQTAIIRVASGMSRSIDTLRPRSLTDRQLAKVNRHPEVIFARRVRDRLVKQVRSHHTTITRSKGTTAYEAYQRAQRMYLYTKRTTHKAMIKLVKTRYRDEQPVADIMSQLRSGGRQQSEQVLQSETQDILSSERRCVLAALFMFAPSKPADDCMRRSEAVNAVAALCKRQQPPARKACRSKTADLDGSAEAELPAKARLEHGRMEQDPFPTRCLPTQCIFCIGELELSLLKRLKSFRNRDGLKRHFHRKHLQHLAANQRIKCPHPKCLDVWLEHTIICRIMQRRSTELLHNALPSMPTGSRDQSVQLLTYILLYTVLNLAAQMASDYRVQTLHGLVRGVIASASKAVH
ncbi:hypothetical protein LTR53_009843 [Teratosphaeriaceae sp. CCFEE 6253]|nr:hypothetical protein LTR53_009843 [Teratosphaeriaceae sp. CCFEE 6253]